jgi:uncharacterized membrane protein
MRKSILYCGDHDLDDAARYLAACIKKAKFSYHYLRSNQPPGDDFLENSYLLYILSDYPSANFTSKQMKHLIKQIYEGASLLMIGGWGSFKGVDGDYGTTPLSEILPVTCLRSDDRVQGHAGYRIVKNTNQEYFKGLDFDSAPGVAGFNLVTAKKSGKEILSIEVIKFDTANHCYSVVRREPFLVLGSYGMGRVAALTTDLAPHWAGGFVDWGKKRLNLKGPGDVSVDIGEQYFQFVEELLALVI